MRLFKEQEFMFYSYRDGLTAPQWKLLQASFSLNGFPKHILKG